MDIIGCISSPYQCIEYIRAACCSSHWRYSNYRIQKHLSYSGSSKPEQKDLRTHRASHLSMVESYLCFGYCYWCSLSHLCLRIFLLECQEHIFDSEQHSRSTSRLAQLRWLTAWSFQLNLVNYKNKNFASIKILLFMSKSGYVQLYQLFLYLYPLILLDFSLQINSQLFIRMKRLQVLSQTIKQTHTSEAQQIKNVYIVAAKRTPIGSYMGKLSSFTGPELGAHCIKSALKSISLSPGQVQEVILGNVLTAGVGQAPARQAAILGGLDISTTCTTINKVCSSGMKSVVFGSQSIQLGYSDVVVAGGFESMSNAPHLIMNARKGVGHGDRTLVDSLTFDGLTDPFKNISMGLCAQKTAKQMKISREAQDQYCKLTYKRHIEAVKNGYLREQIAPVSLKVKDSKQVLDKDQEAQRYKQQSINKLKPAFDKNGTITSANASKINDGACCIILMSESKVKSSQIKPLARIIAYADAEVQSVDFCRSPYFATVKALKRSGLDIKDIDCFEYNEAFSVVPIVMMEMLGISKEKINVLGGAVAMGHPIGASGARIIQTLITALKLKKGRYGLAAICNGGGGSTAVIIENIE